MPVFVYYSVLFLEALIAIFLAFYLGSLVYSSIMGAPYVPTKRKLIKLILKTSGLQKGQKFLDLGCGDGRVVLLAAKEFHADANGVDVNVFIILVAKLKAKLSKINATFFLENLFNFPLSNFDVIYIFLFPEMISKLAGKIKKEAKKGAVIISHGFKIDQLRKYLIKTVKTVPFHTYFYKIN